MPLVKQILVTLIVLLSITHLHAQDTTGALSFKYVVLHHDPKNNAAPDYQKIRTNLEDGIKDLLQQNKVPMLKYQKEAEEKKLQECDTLVCTYTIIYANGLMLNAKIKCALTFTNCHHQQIYTIEAGKMTGAVAGADVYLKVFAKLITPGLIKKLAAVGCTN